MRKRTRANRPIPTRTPRTERLKANRRPHAPWDTDLTELKLALRERRMWR